MAASRHTSVPSQTLSLKLPLKAHQAVKKRAVAAGITMSDYYVGLIDRFVSEAMPKNPPILSYPLGATTVSVVVSVEILQRWRDVADEFACTIQGIAMTAVDEHLFGRLVRAA
jgi:hypothetical protein